MDEAKARAILGNAIKADNSLDDVGAYLSWSPNNKLKEINLDGYFSVDQLEAIAWWVRQYGPSSTPFASAEQKDKP